VVDGGDVGIGTGTPGSELDVNGNIRQNGCVSGDVQADANGELNCTSDERLKNIFGSYTGGLTEIKALQTINYSLIGEAYVHSGFSAQNVATVIPQAAPVQESGYYGLDSTAILATAVNAIQELDYNNLQVRDLAESNESRISTLETLFNSNERVNLTVTDTLDVQGTLVVNGDTYLQGNLVVSDSLTVAGKIKTTGAAPIAISGAVLSALDTAAVEGNDTAGQVTLTIDATSTATAGGVATIVFDSAFDQAPRIALTAKDAASASVRVYVETTATGFKLFMIDQPAQGATYTFDYIVIQ